METRTFLIALAAGTSLIAGSSSLSAREPSESPSVAYGEPAGHAEPAGHVEPAAAAKKPVAPKSVSLVREEPKAAATKGATKPGSKAEPAPGPGARSGKAAAGKKIEMKAGGAENEGPTADEVIALLQEGNARWAANKPENPSGDLDRRAALARDGQKPLVTIVTCSDSRLPVERIFDRGVGDLFVVRVAGNVAGDSETGTVEYGVGHLHTRVLLVMGHTKCGAVAAAASGAQVHGKVAGILKEIAPAVDRAKKNFPSAEGDALVNAAVRENVWQTIFDLFRGSSELRLAASSGELKVIGAVCDISTGKVEWMGEHPWQAELFAALQNNANQEANQEAKPEADAHTTAPEGNKDD